MHRLLVHYTCNNADLYKFGIYCITCNVSGRIYIGQTQTGFINRWLDHQRAWLKNKHHSIHLQRAFNKYGIDQFMFSIIEIAPFTKRCNELVEWLNEREAYWIKHYRDLRGYDMLYNATGGAGGILPTPELRHRLSQSQRKRIKLDPTLPLRRGASIRVHYDSDPEARKRQSTAMHIRYNSTSERDKISKGIRRRNKEQPEVLEKQGESLRRYYELTPGAREKKSKEVRTRYKSKAERDKISKGVKRRNKERPDILEKQTAGVIRNYAENPNTRKKQSKSQRQYYELHPERKTKVSKASKRNWENEELRNRMRTNIKAAYARPEVKAKIKLIRQRTALTNGKRRAELNRQRQEIANAILAYYYIDHPEAIRLNTKRKMMLINDLATKSSHWFIIK